MLNRKITHFLPLILVLTPMMSGSPAEAQPRGLMPQRPTLRHQSYHDLERTGRDLAKAERHLLEVQFLSQRFTSPQATELVEIGIDSLDQARSAYQTGNFFMAREQAKAAENLFKAAQALYEGESGFTALSRSPSRSFFEAPFRAQEYLMRLEAEIAYYGIENATVTALMNQSQQLLAEVSGEINTYDHDEYAQSRAARHSARAALHLIAADRGF